MIEKSSKIDIFRAPKARRGPYLIYYIYDKIDREVIEPRTKWSVDPYLLRRIPYLCYPYFFPRAALGRFTTKTKKFINFFYHSSSKICIFDTFFTFTPAVLSNAAPDLPDTMYGAQGLDAHHSRLGRATVRRTAQKVSNFLRIFVPFWSPFILTIVRSARPTPRPVGEPAQTLHRGCRLQGGEEDLFYLIFRGPAQTLHQGGAGWGRGLILPNPPGSSRGRFWGASYGSPNRALGRKLSDFAGFYIEFFINFDWGSGVLPMIHQNR